jgi:hypothetical protein
MNSTTPARKAQVGIHTNRGQVPSKKDFREHAVRVNISLPPAALETLDRLAEARGMNRSETIAALANEAAQGRKRATSPKPRRRA